MAAPKQDFHLFVVNILTLKGTTSSITFGVARDLYRWCKYVVYGSYGSTITRGLKLPCNIFLLYFEAVDQNCQSSGVQELKLL